MASIINKIAISLIVALLSIGSVFSQNCTPDTIGLTAYLATLNLIENAPLTFEVQSPQSTFAVLHGSIGTGTPQAVDAFIAGFPSVTTLVFMQIPGSDDDDANLIAAQKLRNRGYKNYLPGVQAYPQEAYIASGGVDLFISGTTRIIDITAEVGVHSWSNGTNEASDFPSNSPVHTKYINYYVAMGMSQQDASAFYFFAINAAGAMGIHNMTEAEIVQYKLRLCGNGGNPTCTTTNFTSNADINSNTIVRAPNSITLNKAVLINLMVLFYAGNEIILNSGAQVNSNSELEIRIENCGN